MSTITTRQATLAEIDLVVPLFDGYRQFYGQGSDAAGARQFLLDRFEHGESVIFLAFDGEQPVGFTQLYPSFSSVSMGRIFILNDLFVSDSGRRKGVGATLLAAASKYASTVGAIRLGLSTGCTNTTAQRLYEAQGWVRDDDFFYTCTIRPQG